MTKREIKDVAASVRQRLQNIARETGRPFGETLQYYAMERFLYRLSKSAYSKKFVLKGAMMLISHALSNNTLRLKKFAVARNAVNWRGFD